MAITPTQRVLSAAATLANCLTAGAVSTFPLWSPPLSRSLHLTSAQSNLLASSAILGEYATAATWGAIADSYGPGAVSIGGGACFGFGLGLLGLIAKVGAEVDRQGKELHRLLWVALCVTYFVAGCGVAGSYFSAMIAATKSAPARHSGLAIGVPCAVFGLSPLFLSALASLFTTSFAPNPSLPDHTEVELDAGSFLLFLAALLSAVNGVGGLFLKELPWDEKPEQGFVKPDEPILVADAEETGGILPSDEPTERSALLSSRSRTHSRSDSQSSHRRPLVSHDRSHSHDEHARHRTHHHPHHHPHSQTLRQFVSTRTFWLFGSLILLSTGPVEMYMASLGQILESLLAVSTSSSSRGSTGSHALASRKNHIAGLAVANTVSRLIVGALSDYLSAPSNSTETDPSITRQRGLVGWRVSRLVFLSGACATLAAAFAWGGTGLRTEAGLWVITLVAGFSYGTIFTLSPAIVRSCWPVEHFGRNWGVLTWFSAIGALLFTPLFGLLRDLATTSLSTSVPVTPDQPILSMFARPSVQPICAASSCYRPIFLISAVSAGFATGVVALLWKKWNRVV
ncbi:hypothetical protein JCM10212_000295 [Sporobolomyces blumeae]